MFIGSYVAVHDELLQSGGVDVHHLYLENAREALVPPNPKLFDRDTLTSFC